MIRFYVTPLNAQGTGHEEKRYDSLVIDRNKHHRPGLWGGAAHESDLRWQNLERDEAITKVERSVHDTLPGSSEAKRQ